MGKSDAVLKIFNKKLRCWWGGGIQSKLKS